MYIVHGTHRRDSCMKGLGSARRRSWGSLTTHLQEVFPSCKGEQSLTFKETRPRRQYCCPEGAMVQSLPTDDNTNTLYLGACLKWTEKFELETPKTHLYHFTISLWSWTTENLDLLLFSYQKTLACYRNNHLPVREGDTRGTNPWGSKPLRDLK